MTYSTHLLLQAYEIAALRILDQWEKEADKQAAYFKRTYSKAGKLNSPALINLVRQTYQATALFPNDFVNEKLTRFGFSDVLGNHGLRWLIPARTILQAFETMKKEGVVQLFWFPAFVNIKYHLDVKINVTVQQWAGLTAFLNDKEHTARTKVDLYRLYRRINSDTGLVARGKGAYDECFADLINDNQHAYGDFANAKEVLLQLTDGNTKKTFLQNITCSSVEKQNTDAFYRAFYELFRLIDPDLHLPSEDVYDERGYEGVFFPTYQAKRIRDIVT